jgi:hypothetical protein
VRTNARAVKMERPSWVENDLSERLLPASAP